MSEWAQHELAQRDAQKQLRANEEAEALDPGRQAAAGQSAELAEAPEEPATEQAERPGRDRAHRLFDLVADAETEQAVDAAPAAGGGAPTAQREGGEKDQGFQAVAEVKPPEVEPVAARTGRGAAAAELRDPGRAGAGRGAGREIDRLLAAFGGTFDPGGRPLAFTARRRRRLTDVADPELDALLAAVREAWPAAPVVAPDPVLEAGAEGLEVEPGRARGVLGSG